MKLGLIGAGNMAGALARGIGEPVLVSDVDRDKARRLADELGGEALHSNAEVAERADVVVLCHKPAQLEEVASELAGRANAIASMLAATTTAQLEAAYPGVPVYRFIPNIPAEVRKGVLCYTPGSRASEGPEEELLELFGHAGTVIALEEPQIEPAMALMSCGPAFWALFAESFVEAGTANGLTAGDAARMTVQTMAGTAAYLERNGHDTAGMRARVATPGGTTERGLIQLEEGGVRELVRATVDAVVEATRR
jgi:pyrroline-5-carboxylate reductase